MFSSDAGTGKLKMLLLALKYSRSPEILSVAANYQDIQRCWGEDTISCM